jgi:hypothetical protein
VGNQKRDKQHPVALPGFNVFDNRIGYLIESGRAKLRFHIFLRDDSGFPALSCRTHTAQNLVIKAVPVGLVLGNDLRADRSWRGNHAVGQSPIRRTPPSGYPGFCCYAQPRCSIISASRARSAHRLVSFFNNPLRPSGLQGFYNQPTGCLSVRHLRSFYFSLLSAGQFSVK